MDRARDEAQALVSEAAEDADAATALAGTYIALANHGRHDYQAGNSLPLLEQAQRLLEPVLATHPDDKLALRAMMRLHFTRGDFYRDRMTASTDSKTESDDRDSALMALEQCRLLARRLIELDPGNAVAARDFASAGMPYAQLLSEVGQYGVAERVLNESIDTLSRLAGSDTANVDVRGVLATIQGTLGSVYADQKKFGDAVPAFESAVALFELTYGTLPANTMYRVNLGASYGELGMALRQRMLAGAVTPGETEAYCSRLEHSLSLLDIAPPVPAYVTDLSRQVTDAMKDCTAPAARR